VWANHKNYQGVGIFFWNLKKLEINEEWLVIAYHNDAVNLLISSLQTARHGLFCTRGNMEITGVN